MLRRCLLAVALVAVSLVLGAAPAQAIPPGESLFVISYYDSAERTNLIGQRWTGCGTSGSWGTLAGYTTYHFTPC